MDSPNALNTDSYDVTDYRAIVEARNVNTGSLEVQGLDAMAAYQTTLLGDPLALNASLSWLTHYRAQDHADVGGDRACPATPASRPTCARGLYSELGPTAITARRHGLNHVGDSHHRHRTSRQTVDDLRTLQLRWQPKSLCWASTA
jgi:iron complex outermembrane receptor protein